VQRTQPKKKKSQKKARHVNTNRTSVSWDGVKEETSWCTTTTILYVLAFLVVLLMVDLYFFVEDPAILAQKVRFEEAEKARKDEIKAKYKRKPRRPTFDVTEEATLESLQQLITDMDDRILVVVFEDADAEKEEKKPAPKFHWKRWERIARTMPKKTAFKRLEAEDLPKVVRFNCHSAEAKAACEKIVQGAHNLPKAVFWKSAIPRFFPDDARTDTQVINYLAKQMEEAVNYLDTERDLELAVTDDENLNFVFFGADTDRVYHGIADILRDVGKFSRTDDQDTIDSVLDFAVEVPSMYCFRNFDESPLLFPGNLTDPNEIAIFVRETSVPMFAEWGPKSPKTYQTRKLPILFIAYDPTEDETETILEVGEKLSKEFRPKFSFTHLDALMNKELATRIGATELPMVLVLSGNEVKKQIDIENPEESIRNTIKEWEAAASLGEESFDDQYDEEYDEDDDAYYVEEDGDLDAEAGEEGEGDEYSEEEEEKEEL